MDEKKLKLGDIVPCLTTLMTIEFDAVFKTIKKAKKEGDREGEIIGQSYAMGLQRGKDIINNLLKDVKDD